MKKPIILVCLLILSVCTIVNAQKTVYTLPEANKIIREIHNYVSIALDDSLKTASGLSDADYFTPLLNHIDYNEIGKNGSSHIDDDGLRDFIISMIENGSKIKQLGALLVKEHVKLNTKRKIGIEKDDKLSIGGYLVTEVEYDNEEESGKKFLFDINQFRLFFASHFNSGKKANKIDVFAEFNPIPEEVHHQLRQTIIKSGLNSDTLKEVDIEGVGHDYVPFERLFVHLHNVGGSKFGVTLGQFRNPFGLWSDYSSHRNSNATKNNMLVNGFALKKIETGIKVDYNPTNQLSFEAAIVYGRFGRTAPLQREDIDGKKDLVTRVTYTSLKGLSVGGSAYLSEISLKKRTAFGIDFSYYTKKLLLSGEFVHQKNNDVALIAPNISPIASSLSSKAVYLQFDYALNNKLHLFGVYDFIQLSANGKKATDRPNVNLFNGIRYIVNSKVRWTVLEAGIQQYTKAKENNFHLTTVLEINF